MPVIWSPNNGGNRFDGRADCCVNPPIKSQPIQKTENNSGVGPGVVIPANEGGTSHPGGPHTSIPPVPVPSGGTPIEAPGAV